MKQLSKIMMPALLIYAILLGLTFIYNNYSISAALPIAPLVYGAVFAFVYTKRREAFNSIVILMIFAIWFLRIVIIPCIYVMSGYTSNVNSNAGTNNLNMATFLVSFEFFCTGLLCVINKKISVISNTAQEIGQESGTRTKQIVRLIIVFLTIMTIACVISDRSVLASISTIFDKLNASTENAIERRREFLWVRSNSKMVFQIFFNAIYFLQILIPASLIAYVINRKRPKSKKGGYFACLLIAASSVLITTDNNIDSVCIMVACILVIILTYRETVENKTPLLIGFAGLFIFYFLLSKVGSGNTERTVLQKLSSTFCAYFAALPNVSAGFSMKFTNRILTFWGDIVAGVPYMTYFFRGLPKSVNIYNEAVYGYAGVVNQIVPLITSGYQFFFSFAPILTLCVYNMALKNELRLRRSKVVFNKVLFAVIVVNLSIGPCIFGFPNTIKRLCHFVPLIILANINERVTLNER